MPATGVPSLPTYRLVLLFAAPQRLVDLCLDIPEAPDVWDRPRVGITFHLKAAKARLAEEDRGFFDQDAVFRGVAAAVNEARQMHDNAKLLG